MIPKNWKIGRNQLEKKTGSQVLGSWNEEVRANSSFYKVGEAANCS